tara:strand:+ start:2396 stop:3205 length:810 start_codon:yes stop_codon:yes gene_type:complete
MVGSIRELVKNKSIIFVGNSVEMMKHDNAKFIDGFDIVVRFGAAIDSMKKQRKLIGDKTDIWITGQFRSPLYTTLKEEFDTGRLKDTKILVNRCRGNFKLKDWILEDRLPKGMIYEEMYTDDEIIHLMKSKFNKDMLNRREYRPSAGFISLLWFLDKVKTYKSIHLIGFDFFSKQVDIKVRDKRGMDSNCKPHSWHLPCYVLKTAAHDSNMERTYVEDLVKRKEISWYLLSDLEKEELKYTGWMHGRKLIKTAPKYSKTSKIVPKSEQD